MIAPSMHLSRLLHHWKKPIVLEQEALPSPVHQNTHINIPKQVLLQDWFQLTKKANYLLKWRLWLAPAEVWQGPCRVSQHWKFCMFIQLGQQWDQGTMAENKITTLRRVTSNIPQCPHCLEFQSFSILVSSAKISKQVMSALPHSCINIPAPEPHHCAT